MLQSPINVAFIEEPLQYVLPLLLQQEAFHVAGSCQIAASRYACTLLQTNAKNPIKVHCRLMQNPVNAHRPAAEPVAVCPPPEGSACQGHPPQHWHDYWPPSWE